MESMTVLPARLNDDYRADFFVFGCGNLDFRFEFSEQGLRMGVFCFWTWDFTT